MLPHARTAGISGLLEILNDGGGHDDLYRLAEKLAMDVDDLLPIIDAATILGFAKLTEGDVQITSEGVAFAEADIQTRKMLFREAALKHVTILQCIEGVLKAKADHSISDEFFHDILDEHFSADEVERQFETAMNWGRYGEIFDHDPENARLVLSEPPVEIHSAPTKS
jgi:NitT/TauT family transport system ATP-binding protein